MKKYQLILLIISLTLSACTLPLEYSGYTLRPTTHVKVFYDPADAKMDYSIMGRLTSHKYQMDIVVKNFVAYAKKIGGDAILILPAGTIKNGNKNRIYADVLKYR